MTNVVAVLPARGGSKRIPRKNIKLFKEQPAISWPISVAISSGIFDRIVVSTDDAEIANVANAYGAETPFLRDPGLSDDHTGTTDVIRDAIKRLGLSEEVQVCCIYPTALFITGADLVDGLKRLQLGANWVFAIGEYTTPIDRAYRFDGDRLVARMPEMMPKRSQDLEPAYFDAGQFYWATVGRWLDPSLPIWDGAAGIILPPERAVDIDTVNDWKRAQKLVMMKKG
jgi:pseudaminic acid cytidylyltransferase